MKDEGWPTVWRIPRHEGTHVGSATDPLFTTYERPEEKEDGVRGMRRSACGVDGLCNSSSSAGSPSGYDCSVNTSSVYLKRSSHVRPSAAPRRQMVGGAGTQRGVGCVSCGPVGSDVAVHPSPFTPVTLHPCNPSPLHPFTLHPSPFTLHPAPCTLHALIWARTRARLERAATQRSRAAQGLSTHPRRSAKRNAARCGR